MSRLKDGPGSSPPSSAFFLEDSPISDSSQSSGSSPTEPNDNDKELSRDDGRVDSEMDRKWLLADTSGDGAN
jgi:hypothetical protein